MSETCSNARLARGDLDERAVQLLVELVAIDSVNPSLVEGARGESAIVEHLRLRVERAGFSTLVVTPEGHPDRPSLLAWSAGTLPGRCLLLNGHVDTVGVTGMAEPFVSLGTETVLTHLGAIGLRPDLALVAEPSQLQLTASLRGFAVVDVEFAGRAAHTSQADEGVDAVAHLGRFLGAVTEARTPIRALGGELLVSVVRGGNAPFTVADQASATVERRTTPGESTSVALEEVGALLARMRDEDPTVKASARLVVARGSWQLQPEGPARALATILDELLASVPGRTGAQFAAPYWMEAPLFEDRGIPALVCGPSGGGLHAVDEWVDLRQVRAFPGAIVSAVERLAGGLAGGLGGDLGGD